MTGTVRRREWVAVALYAVVLAVVLMVPTVSRMRRDRRLPGWRYTGVGTGHFVDTVYHLSFVRQARDGHLLFETKYAGADSRGYRVYNLFFLTLGRLARTAGLTVIDVYHGLLVTVTVLTVLLVYWAAAQFFPDRRMRWMALLLITTGAGFYWLELLGIARPDTEGVFLIEADTFWCLEAEVIVPASSALVVLALVLADRSMRTGRWGSAVGAGAAAFGSASTHPHDVSLIYGVIFGLAVLRALTAKAAWPRGTFRGVLVGLAIILAAALFVPTTVTPAHIAVLGALGALVAAAVLTAAASDRCRRPLRRGLVVLGVVLAWSLPVLVYHAVILLSDRSFWAYAGMVDDDLLTAGWLWDYGLVCVFAVVGFVAVAVRRERSRLLLLVWPGLAAMLLATPHPKTQRVFLYHGLHVALGLLAVRGLWAVGRALGRTGLSRRPRLARTLAAAGLTLVCLVGVVLNVKHVHNSIFLRPDPPRPLFLPEAEVAALAYLDGVTAGEEVILCLPDTAEDVPLWTGARVYVGHTVISPAFRHRSRQMLELFEWPPGQTPAGTADLLRGTQADFVYVDGRARASGARGLERLLVAHGLAEQVFANDGATVYRVNQSAVKTFRTRPRPTTSSAP